MELGNYSVNTTFLNLGLKLLAVPGFLACRALSHSEAVA